MKNFMRSLLYPGKHEKLTDENIVRMIMPSVAGIILCMVCLAGATWAWFSADVRTQPQSISAASYDITVMIEDENNRPLEKTAEGYLLSAGTEYTVTLTAEGTASKFGGYCVVSRGGAEPLYTSRIMPGGKLSFKLIPETESLYNFTPAWVDFSGQPDISDGDTVGGRQAESPAPSETPDNESSAPSAGKPSEGAEQGDVSDESSAASDDGANTLPENSAASDSPSGGDAAHSFEGTASGETASASSSVSDSADIAE